MSNYLNRFGFPVAALLTVLPILLVQFPPMVDLPQHIAAIASIDSMLRQSYPFAELFELKWITPYWAGYLLVWLFSLGFGYVWASKIVVALAILAYIYACRSLRQYLRLAPTLDWLLLPVPFGFAYYWGFMNFLIALPLGVITIRFYLQYLKGNCHWIWIILLLNLLFFAHLLVTFFIIGVCGLFTLRRDQHWKNFLREVLPLTSIIPVFIAWFLINLAPSSRGAGPWEMGLHRITQLIPNIFSLPVNWTNIVVGAGLMSVPFLLGGRLNKTIAGIGPFIFYVLFMLLAPNYLLGNFFTYNRFNSLGLILYLMCFTFETEKSHERFPKLQPVLAAVVPIVACLMVLGIAVNHRGYNTEAKAFDDIVKEMQPEKRALSLIANRNSAFVSTPVYLHYPLWYQAMKNGLVDFNFAYWPGLNFTYKADTRPIAGDSFVWHPEAFDWTHYNADEYDYFVVKADPEFTNAVMGRYADRLILVAKVEDWWLFANNHNTRGEN